VTAQTLYSFKVNQFSATNILMFFSIVCAFEIFETCITHIYLIEFAL